MPSSISSSERCACLRVPALAPWRLWLTTLVLVLTGAIVVEGFWRARGHRASVVDDPDLWAQERAAVYGERTVVLLGASRMVMGFSTATFHQRFPDRPLRQLAVAATLPRAALLDLAADPAFRGTVICALLAGQAQANATEDTTLRRQYVDYYHRERRLCQAVERRLRTWLQERLVLIHPQVSLRKILLESLASHCLSLPRSLYAVTLADRSMIADFTRANVPALAANLLRYRRQDLAQNPPLPPAAWLTQALELAAAAARIEARGGRVAFVRFPTSGPYDDLEESAFPRAQYWDEFARRAGTVTINYADVPTLRDLHCAEGSHLDARDTPAFTAALLDKLVRRGVLPSAR